MIGNDVVDLADAETQPDALHPRFDARVFTRTERALLRDSGAPNRLRWIFWAAKEAAYKVVRKLDPRAMFAPNRFEVELDAGLRGRVRAGDRSLAVLVHESEEAVHAIARDGDLDAARILWASREVPEDTLGDADPSAAVRKLAVEQLAAHLGTPAEALSIERDGCVPRLHGPAGGAVDVSLSHHGRLVAFACELRDVPDEGGPRR